VVAVVIKQQAQRRIAAQLGDQLQSALARHLKSGNAKIKRKNTFSLPGGLAFNEECESFFNRIIQTWN
jgi:hypothetical protein